MKKVIGAILASMSFGVSAQVTMLPMEDTGSYLCGDIKIGYSLNGMWAYYLCHPYGSMPIGTPTRIIWIASPYPVRLDLIGNRLETINNSADKKAAANRAWARFVGDPNSPALSAVKADMRKAGIPLPP